MNVAERLLRTKNQDGPDTAAEHARGRVSAASAKTAVWNAEDMNFQNELIARLGPRFHGFTGGKYAETIGGGFVQRPARSVVGQYILHHTAGPSSATGADIWRYHTKTRGWDTDGYHMLVSPDGSAELLIPPSMMSYGAARFNPTTVHICCHGNYTLYGPSAAMLQTVYTIFLALDKCYGGKPWRGHKEIMPTACPGALLPHLERMRGAAYGDAAKPPVNYP